MGGAKNVFTLAISVVNFIILAFVFQKVLIYPMIEAVRVRGAKVTSRLKEIGQILTQAKQTEANYQEQFAKLAAEEEELRATNKREVERVTSRIRSNSETEARHVVEKARREGEKMRVDALQQIQHHMVVSALVKVEDLLSEVIDLEGHDDLNRQVLGKVVAFNAS